MHRRIICIALTDIRIEIARERETHGDGKFGIRDVRRSPLAVIVARPLGAVKTERDVLGNTRIDFVSREAGVLGVSPGQTVAAARAKCAELRVRVVAESAVQVALARIAEAALAFGPTTAFDIAQDVVWVDVGGCAHLHGGEVELARNLGARVGALGHAYRLAVADGPRLAAAIARFSQVGPDKAEPIVVPAGKGAVAMRALPIEALSLDEDVSSWLVNLGLLSCGDLQKLPRRALGMRLGERVHDVMQLLDGRDHAPLEAWRPPEVPEERVELDWGVHTVEAIAFVLKRLCDRLAVRLHGRALAAARLEVVLTLDRALCGDTPRAVFSIALPSPIARAADLFAVVRTRLEECSLAAPVLAVTLRAPELARAQARTLDLLEPEPKADSALPRLIAELLAQLGEGTVGTLALADSWSPTERTRLIPFAVSANDPVGHMLVTSVLEPSRLVHTEQVLSRGALAGARHLARIEAVEWWRRGSQRHDLFAAWIDSALAWLELRDIRGVPVLRGWMD
jgi:protein ImuB